MPDVIPCTPGCCTTTPPVNIPGPEAADGADGTNGINAFSYLGAIGLVIPEIGSPAASNPVLFDTTEWMVIGQKIVFDGPATFRVTSIPTTTTANLTFLGYAGDLLSGTISAGAEVSPSGTQPAIPTYEAIANTLGTPYDVLDTGFAKINFTGGGSSDPELQLPSSGKYILFASARCGGAGMTNGAVLPVNVGIQLFGSNNGVGVLKTYTPIPALANTPLAEAYHDVPFTAGAWTEANLFEIIMQPIYYETVNPDDIIQLRANANALGSIGGIIQITQAAIVAVKLS